MISRQPRGPVTVRMAARMDATDGLAKTPPATAAVSMPSPQKPPWAGSCPEPPPEMSATWLPFSSS